MNKAVDLTWREIALMVRTNYLQKVYPSGIADADFSSLIEKGLAEEIVVEPVANEVREAKIAAQKKVLIDEVSKLTFDGECDSWEALIDLIFERPRVVTYHQLTEKGRALIAAQTDAGDPYED